MRINKSKKYTNQLKKNKAKAKQIPKLSSKIPKELETTVRLTPPIEPTKIEVKKDTQEIRRDNTPQVESVTELVSKTLDNLFSSLSQQNSEPSKIFSSSSLPDHIRTRYKKQEDRALPIEQKAKILKAQEKLDSLAYAPYGGTYAEVIDLRRELLEKQLERIDIKRKMAQNKRSIKYAQNSTEFNGKFSQYKGETKEEYIERLEFQIKLDEEKLKQFDKDYRKIYRKWRKKRIEAGIDKPRKQSDINLERFNKKYEEVGEQVAKDYFTTDFTDADEIIDDFLFEEFDEDDEEYNDYVSAAQDQPKTERPEEDFEEIDTEVLENYAVEYVTMFEYTIDDAIQSADNTNVAAVLSDILSDQVTRFGSFDEYVRNMSSDDYSYVMTHIHETLNYKTKGDELITQATSVAQALSRCGTGMTQDYEDRIIEAALRDSTIVYSDNLTRDYFRGI